MAKRAVGSARLAATIAGYNIEADSISIDETQATAPTSRASTKKYSSNLGSGIADCAVEVTGVATMGAASTNPGLGAIAAGSGGAAGASSELGVTCTFTLDTALSLSGDFVVRRFHIGGTMGQAGARCSISLINGDAADPVVAWPVT